jgi:hypothetical protein
VTNAEIKSAISAKILDVALSAKTMPRFLFVLVTCARQTRTAALSRKNGAEGWQVRLRADGWTYGLAGGPDMIPPCDAGKAFDVIRRTVLGHLTSGADAFRCDVLCESACLLSKNSCCTSDGESAYSLLSGRHSDGRKMRP